MKKLFTKKDLDRAIRNLRRDRKLSDKEKEGEEWALILQFANNNGYI